MQVRFHLEALGETNAHHPFEQLCLGLTRRRIVSNVIPATGPVSAGGDGGRDAESFWSVLAKELPDTSLFTALATDDAVVLAVTAQREGVPTKIRKDLAKVCGKGEPVDRVIYFTVTPVDTARRHELQAHARNEHAVKLEIWDAQAIANEIASPDLFYLAVDFLHVPSSLAPERDDESDDFPSWYLEERDRWRKRTAWSGSMGETVDLREGLRYASLHPEARADLPDWLASARALRGVAGEDCSVLNRIDYEIVIATGFGMDTLKPVDGLLRDWFARLVTDPPDPGVIVDAVSLIRLLEANLPRRVSAITADEVAGWADDLERVFEEKLQSAPGANAKVALLAAAVILAHGPKALNNEELAAADAAKVLPASELYREISAAMKEGLPLPGAPSGADLRDLDLGMKYLVELVETLPSAPMAPLEQVILVFDLTAPALVDHPGYAKVRQALDDATVERSGKAAAGDRAQSRAINLLDAGRPLDALREIHAAKMNWLNGDTAEGAAIMMLLASDVYADLGFPLAAKQYAMSAALVANVSGDPDLAALVARAFMLTASYEHQAGQWLTATRTFRAGIWAQSQLTGDPWSFERYPYFENMCIDQCFILRIALTLRPGLLPLIEPVVQDTSLDELLAPMLAAVEGIAPMGEEEVVDAVDRGGHGRPFSDAGPNREYSWATLENTWIVTAQNDRIHTLAAERFVAAAQITFADLAGEDLLLVPGEIRIVVEVADEPVDPASVFVPASERDPANEAHLIRLTRLGAMTVDAYQLEVAAAALQTIVTHSLLGQTAFVALMDRAFERGLPQMLTCVRPYDDLVDIHKDADYDAFSGADGSLIALERARSPQPADGLRWTLPANANAYDHAASLGAIRERYETLLAPVRLTLPRLATDPTFAALAASLRAEGWKDWHLLTAIANIVVNARARQMGLNMTASVTEAEVQNFHALMRAEEQLDDPETPVESFTKDAMWLHLGNAAAATARGWGLDIRVNLLDPRAFLNVLGDRFNYWSDDVEHDPLFTS